MKIAITGATGFIGRALCLALVRDGHSVVAMTRDPERARERLSQAHAAPNAESYVLQIFFGSQVQVVDWRNESAAMPEVDGVIHLAGESVAGRWSEEKKRRIRESRVEGTRRLVEAIRRADPRPRVLVSTSAVGYYGDRGEEELTEASAPGDDFLAGVCREWEEEAQRAEALGVRVARLRLGVVLARDGGALGAMLPAFRLGLGGPLGDGRQWFPWIHRADVVGLYRLALENEAASGPILAVAPETVRQAEFARSLAVVLRRPAVLPAPAFALRLLLGEFAGRLLDSQRVVPARAQTLGYSFRYPRLVPALRAILTDIPRQDPSGGTGPGRPATV
jgi:uncharacterized protein (TIGR01777 family)